MRYYKKTPEFSFVPGLLREKLTTAAKHEVGFLYVNDPQHKVKIAPAKSREFRLVQALFSPQNFLNAKYNPVTQTYARIFSFIGLSKDKENGRLAAPHEAEGEIESIVHTSIENIKKSEAGQHLRFIAEGSMLRMEVMPLAV